MTDELPHKTALITGGTGGIGLAIANKLSSKNIEVALTDIAESKVVDYPFFQCDVQQADQIDKLYHWATKEIGVPGILILSAGIGIKEKLYEGDPEKWQQVLDVNIMGALRCIRAFVPQMMERGNGHVVFISSVAANQPHIYGGVYCAAKTALDVLAETLRLETLHKIKVTVVSPGAIDTNFFKHQLAGSSPQDLELPKMDPTEIAEDVYYAISKTGKGVINNIIIRPISQQF